MPVYKLTLMSHTNIRIWEYEDGRIQASAQEPKDLRMWGYKPVKYIKYLGDV